MPAKIKGYTLKIYRSNLIYINENLNEIETRNTILHELGHIFCKHDENRIFTSLKTHQVTSKLENQADLFTVAMLINALEEEELERYNLKQLSYMLGISEELLKLYFF
ncbi:ImmA/IrrE family metallo-endopeptidase [Peptoniphilus sp. MSJ-1]|uniref:ImmA/IrrE family metallo-endopeptidase n=2 Tax=Peptoniphilus ovalis TaxID=2841503 RepID=A0ABS6FHC4_9FIRM|nr:ImmA/IrrE family metallo-endopeptidase [Peptoniphilus ovalis]MBU5669577.1 ImmA/IrrE family metallo-endopeptidase [Peptoniphilus ovalis]